MKCSRIAYLDCYSGISGDMILGALVDCGLNLVDLQKFLSALKLDEYELSSEVVTRYGLRGTKVDVQLRTAEKKCRHLRDIERLILDSDLPERVKRESVAIFVNLASAEAVVHNTDPEKVHFHEIGAVDSIVDIVGSVSAFYLLGVEKFICSPLPLGGGMVSTQHGLIPLPAPATLEIVKCRKIPVYGNDTGFELVTPTGAAIVATLCESFGPMPAMTLEQVGYGSGTLDPGHPNYLRILIGVNSLPET